MIHRSLGRVDYESTVQQMRTFTDGRTADTPDELWIVEHEPVFTQGVAGKPEHLLFNPANIPVVKTDRGGQITYHGPGQTVVYILFDIRRAGFGVRELVQRIENSVIQTLMQYGVKAYGKRDAPGVYVRLEPLARRRERGRGEGAPLNSDPTPSTRKTPEDLLSFARELRQSATDAESLMWFLLRNRSVAGAKFRRQHPARGADPRYILDFYCAEQRLAVELDGGQHQSQSQYDAARDAWFASQGIRVLRFWNNEVFSNTEDVLEMIYDALVPASAPSPLAPLPPAGEGNKPIEAKIASLGLKIRNGCSYHGVALNVEMDLTPFSFINPCGYEGLQVTQLADFATEESLEAAGIGLAAALEATLSAPITPKP